MVRLRLTPPGRLGAPGDDRPGAVAAAALDERPGRLGLEVDGVDLTGGRAEGPLLPVLEALLRAVAHLLSGGHRAALPFRDGEVLLLLDRRGGEVLVTLALLERPARLPVARVAVELAALAAAALEASADLCAGLAEGGPPGRPALRRLQRAAGRVARPRPATGLQPWPPASLPPAEAPGPAGPVRLEVTLEEGSAALAAGEGEPTGLPALLVPGRLRLQAGPPGAPVALLDAGGIPLLALRDLLDGLEVAARALRRGEAEVVLPLGGLAAGGRAGPHLRLDLAAGALEAAGPGAASPPVRVEATPLDLAEAAGAALRHLARVAAHADPRLGEDPALAELLAEAAEARDHLAELTAGDRLGDALPAPPRPRTAAVDQSPLGPGRLRRVALRRTAALHVGPPVGPGLVAAGRVALALGTEALVALHPATGEIAWRAPGALQAFALGPLLLVRRGERLEALDAATGRARWTAGLPGERPGDAALAGSHLLLAGPGEVVALASATGQVAWRRPLPGSSGLRLAALGAQAAVATDAGVVSALDPAGAVAWRVRGPGPALAAPVQLGRLLATVHATGATAALLLLDAATGARRGEVALDLRPAGAPVRFARGLALGGAAGGEAVLILAGPGGRRWEVGLPLGGAPLLAAAGDLLVAAGADGALAAIDAGGAARWTLPPAGEGGAAPALARGVVVAARDGVALLDAASGRLLAHHPGHAPARLLAAPDLALATLDADGLLTGLQAGGHLSVVG